MHQAARIPAGSFAIEQRHRMRPTQPLRQHGIYEPASDSAWKAAPLDGRKGADQHSDSAFGRGKMPKLVGQIVRPPAIPTEIQRVEHAGDIRLGQKLLHGPRRQPTPAQIDPSSRADIVAGTRKQNGIAQSRFVFDPPGLPCRHRRRGKRQSLPPGAGPSLLPAHNCIERADGGAGGDRDVLKTLRGKTLRVRNGAAQPARQRNRRSGRGHAGQRAMVARRGFRAQNHCEDDESRRRF